MVVMDLEWNYAVVDPAALISGGTLRFEIIQIGAAMIDSQGKIIKTFDRLIEPQVHPSIKRKVTELTGLTEQKLKGQPSFPQVWEELSQWMGQNKEIVFWGNCDRSVLLSNLIYHKISKGEDLVLYDLQALYDLALQDQTRERQQTALSAALTELDIQPYGQYHSALADAVNAAFILKKLGGEEFVYRHQPELLEFLEKKAQSKEPDGVLVMEKRFRSVADPDRLQDCIQPELEHLLSGPVTEVLPGFYRNHKKIWAYRTEGDILKVTSKSKPSQSGKGKDYVVRFFKIESKDLDKLCSWCKKSQQVTKKKYPHSRLNQKASQSQENFLAQRNRKIGQ